MGVPAFFRWLSRKYVSIIVDAVEERRREIDGVKVPTDCTQPNQNFQEFDNLYLDMNGIIHPCTHPEDRPAPKTEEEMFILIFEYIDRLFSIVRPRKLIYMAVDGVAPRAKMNQQRSRRFRASKETAEKMEQITEIRKKLEADGLPLPPPRKEEEHFDSNCITPGTPFMARLSTALRYYIHKRITYDLAWQKIQVILSDANVPGEGEHKIMDYVRRQRASPSHDPNIVHCLCGADADLIMLGLATHEANFNIIREEFVPNQPRPCELCGQYGHELKECQGMARAEAGPDQADPLKKEKNFIFIRLPVLREYLERELFMPNLPFSFDLERAIDDWVMMCFFVGNDFLPHLPSLEIRENAIDRLIKLYKNMVYQTGGWLTHDGEVFLDRVKMIMIELGKVEDEIFRERQLRELKHKENQKNRKKRAKELAEQIMPYDYKLIAPNASAPSHISGEATRKMAAEDRMKAQQTIEQAKKDQAQKLKSLLTPTLAIGSKRKAEEASSSGSPNGAPPTKSFKDDRRRLPSENGGPKPTIEITTPSGRKVPLAKGVVGALYRGEDESDEEHEDNIRLWEAGWKDRYYQAKFQVSETDIEFRKTVACAYMEGLCWVLKYYYQGCASWTWFYPFHYAPFASDFELIGNFKPAFNKQTKPFKPLEQLMGVFPAASRAHIPEGWRWLMTDPKSPIIDFYPEDFEIDLNGKKYAWQGVALLPFVDEKRLLETLDTLVYHTLTSEEQARNITGPDRLFIGDKHELFPFVYEIYQHGETCKENPETEKDGVLSTEEKGNDPPTNESIDAKKQEQENENKIIAKESKIWAIIDTNKGFGMAGEVSHDVTAFEYHKNHSTMFRNSTEFSEIKDNACIMVEFRDPQFPMNYRFKATRLEGIKELPRVLKPKEWDDRRQGQYRPQIGFTRDVPRASLSSAGHRTLHNTINEHQRRSGPARLQSFQQHSQASQPLPWHNNAAPPLPHAPLLVGMNGPQPLNFMQMAMPPPPPLPPPVWLNRQNLAQQQHMSPMGQWGQPPGYIQQQPAQQNRTETWDTWRERRAQRNSAGTTDQRQHQQNRQQNQQPHYRNSADRERQHRQSHQPFPSNSTPREFRPRNRQ